MALEGATCSLHPDRPAAGTCTRCGRFLCAPEVTFVTDDLRPYCPECAARPDVDWLAEYQRSLTGKRDSWAWLMGFASVWLLAAAFGVLTTLKGLELLLAPVLMLAGAVGLGFFLGKAWARPAIPGVIALFLGLQVALGGVERLFLALLFVPFLLAIFNNTRNRLFFKLPVTTRALRVDYDRLANNLLASHALGVSLLGWLVPLLAPAGFAMGLIAFRRVNPDAKPPVGRKFTAVAAMVLGALGVASSTLIAFAWFQQLRR